MSESDDLKTIATLLGNLIERIEKMEEQQSKIAKHLKMTSTFIVGMSDQDKKFREAVIAAFGLTDENFKKFATIQAQERNTLTTEDTNARRHGEINEWNGDLSRKLSTMQIALDRMEGTKKEIFG